MILNEILKQYSFIKSQKNSMDSCYFDSVINNTFSELYKIISWVIHINKRKWMSIGWIILFLLHIRFGCYLNLNLQDNQFWNYKTHTHVRLLSYYVYTLLWSFLVSLLSLLYYHVSSFNFSVTNLHLSNTKKRFYLVSKT